MCSHSSEGDYGRTGWPTRGRVGKITTRKRKVGATVDLQCRGGGWGTDGMRWC